MVGRDYRLTKDMREAAAALQLNLAQSSVSLRQAYADAPGQGTFVWNMGYAARDAATEIETLFAEIVPEAIKDNVVSMERKGGKKVNANS